MRENARMSYPFDGKPTNLDAWRKTDAHREQANRDADRRAEDAREIADWAARQEQREAMNEQGRAYLECGG